MVEAGSGLSRRFTSERRFYSGMAIAMLLSVFLGFAPTFFLRPLLWQPRMLPLTPLVLLHGAIFTSWALLFLCQTSLVAARRTDIHRKLGIIGAFLVLAMAIVGTLTALHGVARASGPPIVPPLSWLAVPLLAVPAYTGLIVAGLLNRRTPQTHKRLMLLSMVIMMSPSWGRIAPSLAGQVLIPALFLAPLILWDRKSIGRLHKATLAGGGVALTAFILPLLIWRTEAWLAFARWAVSFI